MKPSCVLLILDGWGHSEDHAFNAIHHAQTPHWDELWNSSPTALLRCSGKSVGLPSGQMGNSEVGHMTLGAGRVIHQDLTRIDSAIADGTFQKLPALLKLFKQTRPHRLHVLGLMSPGGVHSHERHIQNIISQAADNGLQVAMHAFLDGRDTPPKSATNSLKEMAETLERRECGAIATICGRYYAMDRDNRWQRTQLAYQAITEARAEFHASNPLDALDSGYERGESDEFIRPTTIGSYQGIECGDSVLFMNFRADRVRQLSRAFVHDSFTTFARQYRPKLHTFATLMPYAEDITHGKSSVNVCALLQQEQIANGLGQYYASLGLHQLRIAETEKYAHVTYFFSGGKEEVFQNEDRKFVPSPQVSTYDIQPEMSAPEVTAGIVDAIESSSHDLIVANFANGDMVGHTGNFDAAKRAVEAIDLSLGQIIHSVEHTSSHLFITADHGNVESLFDQKNDQSDTRHTVNDVPFVYFGPAKVHFRPQGSLADVAPTILNLMALPIPSEMTGKSLLR